MRNVLPRGTSLRTSASQLSVLSYNLLADIYVRPIDERTGCIQEFAAFRWAEPADVVLAWKARMPRLLAELQACEADILCLQEVQYETMATDDETKTTYVLPEWLQAGLPGYASFLPKQRDLGQMAERNERVLRTHTPVANALLYRKDRLELVEPESGDQSKALDATTRLGVCLRGRRDSPLAGLPPLGIFCVHLDATSEATRVKQLSKCVEHARQEFGVRDVLIAGDMNTELLRGSCVRAMLGGPRGTVGSEGMTAEDRDEPTQAELERECASALRLGSQKDGTAELDGEGEGDAAFDVGDSSDEPTAAPTTEQMAEWRGLYASASAAVTLNRVALSRVPTAGTRAAYAHGASDGPCVSWALDHILFTPRSLRLDGWWATLEADADSVASGTPNRKFPSDHVAIAACFEYQAPPALPESDRLAFLGRIDEMRRKHEGEAHSLDQALLVAEAALDAKEKAAAAEAAALAAASEEPAVVSEKPGKKSKLKKPRPSDERIALTRLRREKERELKAAHLDERTRLLDGLSELELDALEAAKIDLVTPRYG